MGTTSEKLTYLNGTKTLLKDVINYSGAGITSETTFRNYAVKLYDAYIDILKGEYSLIEGMPKGQVEGISAVINNAEDLPVYELKMTKESTQATSILPSGYTQVDYIESHGTEYIDTELITENSIPIKCVCKLELTDLNFTQSIIGSTNNVSTNNRCFVLDITDNNKFEIGYKDGYNVSGNAYVAQANTIYNIETYISDGLQYLKLNNNSVINVSRTGTLNNPYDLYLFCRNISNNKNFYAKIKLYNMQLYSNNILVRDFIPCYRNSNNEVGLYDLVNDVFYTNQGTGAFSYGSVAQIPNPDYPQEVKVVEGIVNLFDENTIYNYTFDTSTGKVIKRDDRNAYVASVKPNTTYVISRSVATSTSRIAYLENFGGGSSYNYINIINISTNLTYSFTTPENCNYVMFLVGADVATNLQLTESDQELPYVPYGSNYILYKQVGKNLFDKDLFNTFTSSLQQIQLNLNPNTTYTMSSNILYDTPSLANLFIHNSTTSPSTTTNGVYNGKIVNVTTNSDGILIIEYRNNHGSIDNYNPIEDFWYQLEQGTTATSNEAYKESIVPIPLNNNILAGIGDYKDELKVDKSGHVFINKKTGKVVLDGSESWTDMGWTVPKYAFRTSINNIKILNNGNDNPVVMSNYYQSYTTNQLNQNLDVKYGIANRINQSQIIIRNDDCLSTTDFKNWLSTNNTEVYYVLATPELIDLQTTVDLKLFKGVNNISNLEDGNMSIRYVESIESIVNSLESRISALEGGE